MLRNLHIRNFALIELLEIEFSSGLNIITGETGAGKSVIVDALMLTLGGRASFDMIRRGEKKALIEAVFEIPESHPANDIIEQLALDSFGREMITRRELYASGKSRCFVNDTPVPLSDMKKFGDVLIDFHGQHDHQSLLRRETHIEMLDRFLDSPKLLTEFENSYGSLSATISEYKKLQQLKSNLREKEDFLRNQLAEIEKVDPEPDEDTKTENELRILENSEMLYETCSGIYSSLYSVENSVHDRLTEAENSIKNLSSIDDSFKEFAGEISSAAIAIDEVAKFCKEYASGISFDPARVEELRQRSLQIKGLTKKFGPLRAIFEKKKELLEELGTLDDSDGSLTKLKEEIELLRSNTANKAKSLSESRRKAAAHLEKAVEENLRSLGIANAVFRIIIDKRILEGNACSDRLFVKIDNEEVEINPNGIDIVDFFISPNIGEAPMPLAEIASGGEISRVMLSIKSALANAEAMPSLVFDEIDTGISGRIAGKVGRAMSELARNHQIIAITHLPQIASSGEANFRISKFEENSRTFTRAERLTEKSKVDEIAKLISGEEITSASIESAKQLIKNSIRSE